MKAKPISAAGARKAKKKPRPAVTASWIDFLSLSRHRSLYITAAVLLLIVIACYANSLANGFVFDDHDLVLDNRVLRSVANIPSLLNSYRPLRDISYVLDFAVWGENPFGFHLTNIIIHAANTLLVFALIRRFTGEMLTAALAAAIFAAHPIQTDAVAYVSGRRDILFSFFYLAAFHSYLSYRRKGSLKYFIFFLALWALSLLSKEMAVSMPILIFVWNFCEDWPQEKAPWWRQSLRSVRSAFSKDKWLYLALSLAAIAYAWYWIFFKHASVRASFNKIDYWGGSFYSNILTVIRVHAWYLKQLVYPTPIAQYFGAFDISRSLFDGRVILALVVVGSVIAFGLFMLRREKLLAFAVLSHFVLLLPVSQIIPHHELLADHYLYLPMMSFGLFVSLLIRRVAAINERAQKLAYVSAGAVVVALAVMTALHNRNWKDDFTLWQANYRAVPNSTRAAFNLAGQYLSRNPTKAAQLYERSLELDPTYAPTYTKLSQIYLSQNRIDDVEALIQRGLSLSDAEIQSFMTREPQKFRSQLTAWLAAAKGKKGNEQEAERLLQDAIRLYPPNMEPYAMLAATYHGKDPVKEIAVLKSAIAANPMSRDMFERLTVQLIDEKRYDEAIPYLERMRGIVPNDFYPNYQLGQIYRTKGDCGKAKGYLLTARSVASSPESSKVASEALRQYQRQCGSL